jgi:hypothetical protein
MLQSISSCTVVKFPIVCPLCGTETLAQRLLEQLVADLAGDRRIELSSDCHEISWPASECERDQLRDYCAVAQFHAGRGATLDFGH